MGSVGLESVPEPALAFANGFAVDWHEPGYPIFLSDTPHVFATSEIEGTPTASEMTQAGEQPWRIMRAAAGAMLSTAGFMPGCDALEVRYAVRPEQGHARVRMFITTRSRSWNITVAQAALDAACASLPAGFIRTTPKHAPRFGDDAEEHFIVELRRHEEVTLPQWDYIPADFYYTINDDPGDGSGWASFWEILSRVSGEVAVSLLFKATNLHPVEQDVIAAVTTDLDLFAEQRMDCDAFGNQVLYPACVNARVARDSWQARRMQLQRPLLARIALKGDLQQVTPVASALASALSARSSLSGAHPMYVEPPRSDSDRKQARFSFDWLEVLPWGGHAIWEEELAPVSLRRMPYLFGINEAASLAILPVPDTQGTPGFAKARTLSIKRAVVGLEEDRQSVVLGATLHRGEVSQAARVPLADLARHSLVVGSPGSGKTTTVMTILVELWRSYGIPFLVIESVKKEYRSLANALGDDLEVYCLGREDISPLRMNPLAPPAGVRREVHVSSVMAMLKLAIPMFPPLPQLLGAALDRTYEEAGWGEDARIEDQLMPPTLRDLLRCFEAEFDRHDYRGESLNVGSAGRVRLESLLRGSQGRLLDTVESSDFAALMERPIVIELDEITDHDDRAVIAAIILDRVRSAARGRGSSGGQLRHVTVIEEAHRLLGKSDGGRYRPDGDDGRAQAVRAFCEAIAELRAQGEGFILSTQTPAQLADAAVTNTGTRVLHRLESAADRNVMLEDFGAQDIDRALASRLRQGEAIARWPSRDEPILIQVQAPEGVDSGLQVDDQVLKARMSGQRQGNQALLPYRLCTREICTRGCAPAVRSVGRALAREQGDWAGRIWKAAEHPGLARFDIAPQLLKLAGNEQTAYCAAVHLSVNGDAFTTKRATDIRPDVIAALRKRA